MQQVRGYKFCSGYGIYGIGDWNNLYQDQIVIDLESREFKFYFVELII